MKEFISKFSKIFLLATIVAAFALSGGREAVSQPDCDDQYCIVWPMPNITYFHNYSRYNQINRIIITKTSTGEVILDHRNIYYPNRTNSTFNPPWKYFPNQVVKLIPGLRYQVRIYHYKYYYLRTRLFIDWTADCIFKDEPGVREYYGRYYLYAPGWNWRWATFYFTVPIDAEGDTRMRILASYVLNYHYRQSPYLYLRDMRDPCLNGYWYEYISYSRQYTYGTGVDYPVTIEGGVSDTYPGEGDILFADEMYDGTQRVKNGVLVDFKKPTAYFTADQPAGSTINFYMWGPMPSTEVIYTGLDTYPSNSLDIDVGNKGMSVAMDHSTGFFSFPKSMPLDGDGTFKADRGGSYKVYGYLAGSPKAKVNTFIVSWNNDLSVSGIVSPRTEKAPQFFKYVQGASIRISGVFQNVGIRDITEFYGIATIRDSDGNQVYRDSIYYSAPPREVLELRDDVELEFSNTRFSTTGVYTLEIEAFLMSAIDQDDYNDRISRQDVDAYTFEVAYEIQLQADAILNPLQDTVLLAGRPIIPEGKFKNVGIGDASDVPATLQVKDSDGNIVYQSDIIVEDVPSGKYNIKYEDFDMMTINEPGDYTACLWLTHPEDPIPEDDTTCITFTVESGLRGVYTVGSTFAGDARNFNSIQDAMDALYLRGITGSITFELTDKVYDVDAATGEEAAWDLTSYIIGLGYDKDADETRTMTWKAHRSRANTRGGVTLNLNTGNGQGVLFGQSILPANQYAIMREFVSPGNANSPGYITFDGGKQKALKVVLNSGSDVFGSAFYLGRGSHHIGVKNCMIENGTPAIECRTWVPLATYDPSQGFQFQLDSTGSGSNMDGYSAGISSRSTLISFEEANFLRLDTVPNSNNVFDGNEISGFGYGILSLGLGAIYMQNENEYRRFYNMNNIYTNNTIHDICRAGILVGSEENTEISHNRIYDIGGGSLDVSGIMAGGNSDGDFDGYNTMGLVINGNEVSGVSSSLTVHGIRVEQVRVTYQDPAGGVIYFPDEAENTSIFNNVVWGLQPTNVGTGVAGIHLFTRRDEYQSNLWDILRTPYEGDYNTRDDKIVNNTVIISDDGGRDNTAPVFGIGVQQTSNAYVYNNAVLFEDVSFDANSQLASAMLYHGVMPRDGGLDADRNAYWLGNANASIYRFIETDADGNVLEPGSRDEYKTLNQWKFWTGEDINSIVGDFSNDMTYTGVQPYRVRMDGTPQGSILNNRGDRLAMVGYDIDGYTRGTAGQRYDIGAFEFDGVMFISDLEMLNIPTPGAYRAGNTIFADAEYIMTEAPVEVTAALRNNGSLQQSDVDVFVRIYREDPADAASFLALADVEETIKTSIASTETMNVAFNLADLNLTEFNPETYNDLSGAGYTVPNVFSTMTDNVTPKYKIEVSVGSDQHNDNNVISKEVRFYLKRSPIRLLVSSENSMVNIYTTNPEATTDEIAGNLNLDSLLNGLHGLGLYTDLSENRHDIDLFDRMGWEPRSVNYTMYRSIFWTDGDDDDDLGSNGSLSRYQRQDIQKFLDLGSTEEKKNFIVGSQELVREMTDPTNGLYYDEEFANTVLRASNVDPGNPLGLGVNNDGNSVMGVTIGLGLEEHISSTEYAYQTLLDMPPYAGLMGVYPEGEGLSRVAYTYVNSADEDNIMGIATTSISKNIVHLGVDWRHWSDMDRVLRAVLDFVEKNGGKVFPVELVNFDAKESGKRVDLIWATASELNSSVFEIERADKSEAGRSAFAKIDEVAAAGKSAELRDYSAVDYNVEYGRSYVYRLKMVDLDGNYEYSEEKVVRIGESTMISLGDATPNPAIDNVTFELNLGTEAEMTISLYDMNGKQVSAIFNGMKSVGSDKVELNVRDLSSGAYTMVLRSGEVVITRKINVQK